MASKPETKRKLSRRSFLKIVGGVSLVGVSLGLTGCSEPLTAEQAPGGSGWLPAQYNIPGSWPTQVRGRIAIDPGNPSITRDDQKCILCGQCIEVCQNIQTVFGNYELPLKNYLVCVNCGQCIHWCPSGAITEVNGIQKVLEAIADPDVHVVVQTAPATRISLGEEFGLPIGTNVEGKQVAALRALGFDTVFDTRFAADLTIIEEGTELIERIKGEVPYPLPQFTSCCPGWVKFVEFFYPELIKNLSTAKSPQQMQGALIKTYYAKDRAIDPKKIFSVSIMPCTAKKFECQRPEMDSASRQSSDATISADVDVVLTIKELAQMIKMAGIDFPSLSDDQYDRLMGQSTGAAMIFAATGGVMEAAVRSVWYLATGEQPPESFWKLTSVRGLEGIKEATVTIPGVGDVVVAVAHGLSNSRQLMERVKDGNAPWHFIEVMACPGGCQNGGGQPRASSPPSNDVKETRTRTIYDMDINSMFRNSHDNPEVDLVYEFLGEPRSQLAYELLHTHYESRANAFIPKKV